MIPIQRSSSTIHISVKNSPRRKNDRAVRCLARVAGRVAFLVAILLAAAPDILVSGGTTKFWTTATYEQFVRGDFTDVSLGREGTLTLAPALEEVFETDQAMVWVVAQDQAGLVYLGTGHSGRVYRLGADLKGELIFDAQEPEIFALAVDADDRLYVGSSPEGKVYRVEVGGQVAEFYDPGATYIWALSFAANGDLYVGTGDRGEIHRVRADGTGELFYETNQTHVMSLALSPAGELLAGTEPNGLLYRISSQGRGFVVYDAPLGEIHKIALGGDGSIYATTLGVSENAGNRQAAPRTPVNVPAVTATTTITVRASDDPSPMPGPQGGENQPPPDASATPVIQLAPQGVIAARSGGRRAAGQGESAIVRIRPDSSVETLWSSREENAFDVVPNGDGILFSTDKKGRIYQLVGEHDLSLLVQTEQEQTTRLIPFGDSMLVATANLGRIYRLDRGPSAIGSYESEIRDAGTIAGWGRIRWRAEVPEGASLAFQTRSGNSSRPDATWSAWSLPYEAAEGEPITSPAARYLQWKVVLRTSANESPVLREVSLAYLPRNRAPRVTELQAIPQTGPASSGPGAAGSGARRNSTAGGAARIRNFSGATAPSRSPQQAINITWQASDPDTDRLGFSLYFRGEGESEWKLLQGDLEQNYYQMGPEVLPDGSYRLKVIASDSSQNPAASARTDERISAPFIVDYTAPQLEVLSVERTAEGGFVRLRATDRTSVLTHAEFSLDAGPLQPVLSDDGIVDSGAETFTIRLPGLSVQEHLVTLRVYDLSENAGLAKAVLSARPPE